MRTPKRLLGAPIIGLVVASMFATTASATMHHAKPKKGGELTIAVEAETDSLNPTQGLWAAAGYQTAYSALEPLMAFGKDQKLYGNLAESFTADDTTFTKFTLKLRPGITFHDGTPFNAAAVKTQIDAEKKSLLVAPLLTGLQSPTIVDDLTLSITTDKAWSSLPSSFAAQPGFMISPKQIESESPNPVGTGPFAFDGHTKDSEWKFKKFDNYWREGFPYFDSVTVRIVPDPAARAQALRNGEVDMATRLGETDVKELRTDPDTGVIEEITNSDEHFVMLNESKPPFDNLKARQALAAATDRNAFVKALGGGILKVADSPWAPGSFGHPKGVKFPKYDVKKAKKLVKAYKAETGKDLEFTLLSTQSPDWAIEQDFLKAMWEKAGIKASTTKAEQTAFIVSAATGDYQATLFSLFPSPDPDIERVFMSSENATGPLAINFPRNSDPVIDAAFDKARSTNDPAVRKAQYKIVAQQLVKDLPYIFLNHEDVGTGYNRKIKNVGKPKLPTGKPGYPTPIGTVQTYNLWKS